MVEHITKYYVTGNTAEGFVNYLSSNLQGIQKIIVLKHPSNVLKTGVLKKLVASYGKRQSIEIIASATSNEYIDGIVIRDNSLAIVADQIVSNGIEGAKYIDLEEHTTSYIDEKKLADAEKNISHLHKEAYAHFNKGLTIHDDLEKVYIDEMNFNKADQVADEFIQTLFQGVEKKKRKAVVYERLFGTNTSDGVVNLVEQLIERVKHRVFIKGRAGTGKSVFMRKVLDECIRHGLDVEVYRCSFDPNSIDMLMIRDLDYCLFDSTDPHEFFPSRPTDEVIDLYEKTVTSGTDEKYAFEIKRLTSLYKTEMKAGVQKLRCTKKIEHEKEENFHDITDREIEFILQKITTKQ